MKFTDALRQALIDEVVRVQVNRGEYFEEDSPPTVEIETKKVAHWIWISTRADYEGASWNPSTDRLKGDPYSAHVFNNWIGEAKSAPSNVSKLEALNRWALFHTHYMREYTDVGSWGVHSGRWVHTVNPDGIVTLRINSSRTFQDVPPDVETTSEQFDLNRFKEISFDTLVQLIKDENAIFREIAAKLFAVLGDPHAVDPFLIQATEDTSQYVRRVAIDALGKLGGDMAIEKLIEILVEKKHYRKLVMHSLVHIGEPVLESIKPLITSEDENLSIITVNIIEAIGGAQSFDILIQVIEDERHLVRARIIDALGNFGNIEAVDVLIENLQNENKDVQQASAQALGRLQDKRAIVPLVDALLAKSYHVRMDAANALSQLEWTPSNPEETSWLLFAKREWEKLVSMGDSASDTIIQALNDEEPRIGNLIVKSINKAEVTLHNPRLIEPILKICKRKDKKLDSCQDAIKALRWIRLPQVVQPLMQICLLEEEHELVSTAFDSLEFLFNSGVASVDILINMVTEKTVDKHKHEIFHHYLKLLSVIPLSPENIEEIAPLLKILAKDDSTQIASNLLKLHELFTILSTGNEVERENTVESIGEIGLASATGWLIEILKDVRPSIRKKAVIALGKLGKGAGSPLISALKCKNRNVRVGVVEALGQVRDRRAAEPLLIALGDQDRIVRQNTAWALGRLNLSPDRYKALRGKIIHALTKAMNKDEYFPVRFNAVYSLGNMDDIRLVKPLLKALFYPEFEMRLNASFGFMMAAMDLHDKVTSYMHNKIIDNLTLALSDDAYLVRYNAADAIRLNGGPKALGILTTLLNDEDEYMREIAARGVKELKPLKGRRPTSWTYSRRDKHGRRYRYELGDPDASTNPSLQH